MKRIVSFIVIAFLLLFIRPSLLGASSSVGVGSARIIVKFKAITPKIYQDSLFKNYGFGLSEKLMLPDTFVVKVPNSQLRALFTRLQQNLSIDYVEEDYVAQAQDIPNDEYYSKQWGLEKIKSSGAWDVTHGSQGVKIAIIDTGIDGTHPDLGSKVVAAADCTVDPSCPATTAQDKNGHGSHVAGIASAITNNELGVAGVAWDGQLMSVKALNDSGSGYYSWVANAIYWATDNGAKVINLSMGSGNTSTTLKNAIDYAWGKGVVIVAAAGNNGSNQKFYPAYYPNVIAVAATDQNDLRASFSNYGSWVDVAAPGLSIYSTYQGGYDFMSGTSMSTPFVTGLAALIFGQNPTWSASQVRNKIESTADKISGTGSYFTYGRINACKAVGCEGVATPTPTVEPSPTPTSTPTIMPTPLPTIKPTPTPTVKPSPTPTPLPWWCRFSPSRCK